MATDPNSLTDLDLVRRIVAGDANAWSCLVTRYARYLGTVIDRRLDPGVRQRQDVDDVLQETWVRANLRIAEYAAEPAVSTKVWLRQLACDVVADVHLKHRQTAKRSVAREKGLYDRLSPDGSSAYLASFLAGSFTTPSGPAVRAEDAERVRRALHDLDDDHREVIELRLFENLSNLDAAADLGITPFACSKRFIRALEILHNRLGG